MLPRVLLIIKKKKSIVYLFFTKRKKYYIVTYMSTNDKLSRLSYLHAGIVLY